MTERRCSSSFIQPSGRHDETAATIVRSSGLWSVGLDGQGGHDTVDEAPFAVQTQRRVSAAEVDGDGHVGDLVEALDGVAGLLSEIVVTAGLELDRKPNGGRGAEPEP